MTPTSSADGEEADKKVCTAGKAGHVKNETWGNDMNATIFHAQFFNAENLCSKKVVTAFIADRAFKS